MTTRGLTLIEVLAACTILSLTSAAVLSLLRSSSALAIDARLTIEAREVLAAWEAEQVVSGSIMAAATYPWRSDTGTDWLVDVAPLEMSGEPSDGSLMPHSSEFRCVELSLTPVGRDAPVLRCYRICDTSGDGRPEPVP